MADYPARGGRGGRGRDGGGRGGGRGGTALKVFALSCSIFFKRSTFRRSLRKTRRQSAELDSACSGMSCAPPALSVLLCRQVEYLKCQLNCLPAAASCKQLAPSNPALRIAIRSACNTQQPSTYSSYSVLCFLLPNASLSACNYRIACKHWTYLCNL